MTLTPGLRRLARSNLREWAAAGYPNAVAPQIAERFQVALDTVDELERRIHGVRELHYRDDDGSCFGCWMSAGQDGAPRWPCATIRVLDTLYTQETL